MADAPSSPTAPPESDPLSEALAPSRVESFLEDYKLQLAIGFGALIVIGLSVIIVSSNRAQRQQEAAQAFTAAETIEDLNAVIARFSGNLAAGNAMLRKAALLEDDGKPAEARTTLLEFRDRFPNHPRLGQALFTLGRMAEEEGELGRARDYYQQAAEHDAVAPLARMHIGDLAMQEGNLEEARETYMEVEREFSENAWSSVLQDRLTEVNQRLDEPGWPEVVPAPEPAAENQESAPAAPETESPGAKPPAPTNSSAEQPSAPPADSGSGPEERADPEGGESPPEEEES